MDTISTIVGPSITLLWPLVGSSLASDWVRFSESNRLSDNVSPKRGGIQPLSFLDIDVLPLYMYIKGQWTLSAPLYGPPSHFCGHLLAVLPLASDWVRLLEFRLVGDGHRSWPCWGGGGDQRLLQLSIGSKGSLLCAEVV